MLITHRLPQILPRWPHSVTWLVLGLLLIAGSFLRLWNFTNTLMFQGDQGRDALIVSQMFKAGDPVFIGPGTSVGSMYLGPFYYYFMLPFLWLTYPSPIGPALGVAAVSIASIPLVYFLGKELLDKRAALLAAFFFTFSASAVEYSRFSWNPNLAPTFGLLIVFFTFRALKRSPWYWLAVALSFGLLIQLHYLALLALGGIGLAWLWQARTIFTTKPRQRKIFVMSTLLSVVLFLSTLLPLILFDIRHEFVNWKALQNLVSQDQAFSQDNRTGAEKIVNLSSNLLDQTRLVLTEHILTTNVRLSLALILSFAVSLWLLLKQGARHNQGVILLLAFLLPSLAGMAFYQKEMHVHYFAFLFTVLSLLFGAMTAFFTRKWWGVPLAMLFTTLYLGFNLTNMPLRSLSWTINDVDRTTQEITSHLQPDDKISLVLLGPSKDLYAQNYRYYLSTTDTPALPPEKAPEADTLVVINEERLPRVADIPIYEIMIFPEKMSEEVYTIPNGPNIHIFRKAKP